MIQYKTPTRELHRISHQHHGTDFQGLSISGSASSLQLSEPGSCTGRYHTDTQASLLQVSFNSFLQKDGTESELIVSSDAVSQDSCTKKHDEKKEQHVSFSCVFAVAQNSHFKTD